MNRNVITLGVALLGLSVTARAEKSPLESDYPDGYWDREIVNYGRNNQSYNVSIAVADPAETRGEIEALLKGAGGKLTGFNDMTSYSSMGGMGMDASVLRMRPAYSMTYQLPEAKAAAAAKKLIAMGRLTQYSVGAPHMQSQLKEAEERIARIDKEKKDNAASLKTMPISRALLDSKLKRLKTGVDAAGTTQGQASVVIQLMRELPEGEKGGRVTLP